jgi:3-hydroxyacyl-CoA dehydrogenase
VEIFIEPINPPPAVVIIGAGHVGKATAHLAKWLGFRVVHQDTEPAMSGDILAKVRADASRRDSRLKARPIDTGCDSI